jgi:hypothetical protein
VILEVRVKGFAPEEAPTIGPPKAIDPPAKPLVLMVRSAVLLRVVGTTPATMNELAAMLVMPVPVAKPKAPELTVIVPRRVVAPILPPKVTVPVAPAVRVSASLPAIVPLMVEVDPEKVMLADPETVVLSVTEVARRVLPVTVIAPPDVEIPAPKEFPDPLAEVPVREIAPVLMSAWDTLMPWAAGPVPLPVMLTRLVVAGLHPEPPMNTP